jgi:hypothetical protein
MKKFKGAVVLLGLFLIAFAPAQAVLLPPATTTTINGGVGDLLNAQYVADAGGPIVADTGVLSFTADTGVYSGTFRQVVYRAAIGNPACPAGGCLDFYYQFSNNAGSTDPIELMTTIAFNGFLTDVGTAFPAVLLGGPGTVATNAISRNVPGSTVTFHYDTLATNVAPGLTANTVAILTDALYYRSGSSSVIDGGVATVSTFAPTLVPEPVSVVLLGTLLLGLSGLFRKKLHFKRS